MDYHLHLLLMKKYVSQIILFILLCLLGCNKTISPLETAKSYYNALDQSDFKTLSPLLADSIVSKEIVYETMFSKNGYIELQRWDSVFRPTYKILEIDEIDGKVKSKISKSCSRILFLNGEPIITEETMTFNEGKIDSVIIDTYVVFNAQRWDSVRSKLVNYINQNHKHLNGFIHNQTVKGALDYIEAIELFNQSTESQE